MVARLQYLRFRLFEMYVGVVFVIRCLYSAVSLTLVREQLFVIIMIIDQANLSDESFEITSRSARVSKNRILSPHPR